MEAKLLDLKDKDRYWGYLEEAAKAIKAGEVVAFPTETVYGLGVNGQLERAVKNLYSVKQRPQEKEFQQLIADLGEVKWLLDRFKGSPSEILVNKLIERFWPGPLTIVFFGYNGKDIGIRFPDHKVALDLVRLSGVLVLGTSANISGSPPATSAQEVMDTLGKRVRIILDGGPCRLRTPSTVLKISLESYEILRVGAISEEVIKECLKECLIIQ